MTYTMITRTKWRIHHGNLSCCWSKWSWMSRWAHEYIGLSPITTRGSVPFEDNHYMHMYGGDACMHVWIPFHNIDVARASKIVHSPHRARSVHDVSWYWPFRLDGSDSCIHMHESLKLYHVILEHDLYTVIQAKKLISLVVRQSSDGPSGPTNGKNRFRW